MKRMFIVAVTSGLLSTMAVASDQSHCKRQAEAAADTIYFLISNDIAGMSTEQIERAKSRLEVVDELLKQERYCEALRKSTAE